VLIGATQGEPYGTVDRNLQLIYRVSDKLIGWWVFGFEDKRSSPIGESGET